MEHVLGEEALAGARLPFDQHRQRASGQDRDLAAQLGHCRRATPEDRPFLRRVLQRQGARDLGRQRPRVDHLVLAEVHQRVLRPFDARVGGGEQHHRQGGIVLAQLIEDVEALGAADRLQIEAVLVPGQELGLREREVEVEDHQVGERLLLPQRLRRLVGVVGALEGAALVPFFADLARMPPPAARDVIELREVPVAHLDRLVAVVDHQQPGHHLSIERARSEKASSSASTAESGAGQGKSKALTASCSAAANASQASAGQGAPALILSNNAWALMGTPSASLSCINPRRRASTSRSPESRRSLAGQTARFTRSCRTALNHACTSPFYRSKTREPESEQLLQINRQARQARRGLGGCDHLASRGARSCSDGWVRTNPTQKNDSSSLRFRLGVLGVLGG